MQSFSATEGTTKMHFNIEVQLYSYFPNTGLLLRKQWPWQGSVGPNGHATTHAISGWCNKDRWSLEVRMRMSGLGTIENLRGSDKSHIIYSRTGENALKSETAQFI